MALCAYCKDSVLEEESARFCPSCDASHHEECWEANFGVCSVFGCESKFEESVLLGCPYCEETYDSGKRHCDICGEPLMNPREFADFLNRYRWEKLPSDRDGNPVLAAGFLRNHGILARVSKKVPISMFHLSGGGSILVPAEQAEEAKELIKNQAGRFRSCEGCGHILFIDEEECSFCSENPGDD
jgi:hypothetical protein